ncbi:hypothetical protein CIHG_05204 [Coccidioides immitis H538.4]|uniref:DSC E3 ubiquitin ligase complex subunit A n=1 Tax=Coccidioides immitis H538.4 TaxID=396776 RepID=A0A0J8RQP0_COCIT|nr:hypothetical protein CIHG_05204 [Coccidioides immitis H538.4]
MDSRRAFLVFLLLFFLFTAPDPHPRAPVSKEELQKQITDEQRALSWLNSSRYGDLNSQNDRWLPLAGLTKDDGYAWGLLPVVQTRARKQLHSILHTYGISVPELSLAQSHDLTPESNLTGLILPVYRNVTGRVRGDWVRWMEPELAHRPNLNLTSIATKHDYFTHEFGRNITANDGRLVLDFQEEEGGKALDVNGVSVRDIRARMLVEMNDALGDSWVVPLFGIHFPATGAIVLTTTSEKFAGITALPHFALSRDSFQTSRRLLNKTLSDALELKRTQPEQYLPWSSLPYDGETAAFPTPKCEYIVYIQQHPVVIGATTAQTSILNAIENELRFPKGAPIPNPPPIVMSAAMISPDCGFFLESKGPPVYTPQDELYLSGLKREEYSKYAKRFIVIIAGIFILHINLLMRQMKESSTPSTRSRLFSPSAFVERSSAELFAFASWIWIQNWVLVSQDILGPRFFVPKTWVPPAYDYHPILRDASASGSGEDLESGDILPLSSLRAEQRDGPENSRDNDKQGNKDRKRKVFDCAICMQDIDVPVLLTPGSGASSSGTSVTESATNLLSRRTYMVTPCRHIFHSSCLETWMRLRLQCPICRESIPPV